MERVEIPPDAGPGTLISWHHIATRLFERGFSPTTRARLVWHVDRHEFAPSRFVLRRFVRPGDVVVDVGAEWGLMADRFAERVGPEGRVISFEPNPAQQPSLRPIAERHPNLTVHQIALSDAGGRAELHVPVSPPRAGLRERAVHAMGSIAPPGHRPGTTYETVSVEVRRLDDLVAEGVVPREVSFLKCDVEGHELAVLRGAEELLRRARPTILIEIEQRHQETPVQAIFDLLAECGYDGYVLDHTTLRPLADFDVQRDQISFLRPNALFSAPPKDYLFEFLFLPEGVTP